MEGFEQVTTCLCCRGIPKQQPQTQCILFAVVFARHKALQFIPKAITTCNLENLHLGMANKSATMSNANKDTRSTVESPPQQTMAEQFSSHLQFVRKNPRSSRNKKATQELESTKAPLFSTDVALHLGRIPSKQYGLLGEEISEPVIDLLTSEVQEKRPNLIYANHSEPWSAFICGVQGSGKSHSLATLVENCLLTDHQIGNVPNPLTAMAFHFDPYSSFIQYPTL